MSQDEEILAAIGKRAAEQSARFPAGFPYDRNGVRLGIASLQDEVRELYLEWEANKRTLNLAADRVRHELLDIAGIVVLMLRNVPE